MDVTDLIDYNLTLLNRNSLTTCFFHLNQRDPTLGFEFDASRPCGNVYPTAPPYPFSLPHLNEASSEHDDSANIALRLVLGSYLARYLRHQLEEQKGYTATAGISTNKLLSKLVGSVNKPNDQTTLLSDSSCHGPEFETNATRFIDSHEIGMIPGIGCKIARKIRDHVLGRPPAVNASVMYGAVKELISVRDVRLKSDMGPALLEGLIRGPGSHQNIGYKIWALMHGVDDSEVLKAKDLPQQISIVSGRPDSSNILLMHGAGRQLS
jgi:DNA polymerase iota